jgi:uncharacterized RDD family membrane protein YckC
MLKASFKRRFVANAIDSVILYIAIIILTKIFKNLPINSFTLLLIETKEIICLFLSSCYHILMTAYFKNATIGKLATGIMIVDKNMNRLTAIHSLGRYLSYYFSYLTLGIGFLAIMTNKNNRAIHDMIANTYVIRKR